MTTASYINHRLKSVAGVWTLAKLGKWRNRGREKLASCWERRRLACSEREVKRSGTSAKTYEMGSDEYLSRSNQVSPLVRHLLTFGSFAGEMSTPAGLPRWEPRLPALPARCELFSSTTPPPNSLKVQTPVPGRYATTPRGLPARGPRSGLELANPFGVTSAEF